MAPAEAAQQGTPRALAEHLRRVRHLRPGLEVHADDVRDTVGFTGQGDLTEALRIVLLLEGSVDVSYGQHRVQLSSAGGRRPTAQALAVSVAEPDVFTRRAHQGNYARRVTMGLGREWLAQAGLMDAGEGVRDFLTRHLAMAQWQASARAVALAEQMVRPPMVDPLLQNIYLESRALELVLEALGHLAGAQPGALAAGTALRPQEQRRLSDLREFLARPEAHALSMDDIARHAGVNATTLQRQFRALYGTSVFDFIRASRLQRARDALQREGVTVSQAASIAGYTSAANFSTAYKRRFGLMPKHARSRI
ncbi:helix-turn-helix transcriptional regulator [Hydrogenophaga sp. BPS33]|nr:helix-turn-helix transcriptional regulator [Hydrogenophaga sp. BPS33]